MSTCSSQFNYTGGVRGTANSKLFFFLHWDAARLTCMYLRINPGITLEHLTLLSFQINAESKHVGCNTSTTSILKCYFLQLHPSTYYLKGYAAILLQHDCSASVIPHCGNILEH